MSEGPCFFCQGASQGNCSRCGEFVCSDQHMQIHRLGTECYPFRVKRGEHGRYVIASRDIQPLELILTDSCSIGFGTKLEYNETVCLECWTETIQVCQLCGLPLCRDCHPIRHSVECKVVYESGGPIDPAELRTNPGILASVSVLRFLFSNHTQDYSTLLDNLDWIKRTHEFILYKQAANFIRIRCKRTQFSEEEIWKVLGIYKSNSCSVANYKARAVFPVFAMINHSCYSNARHIVNSSEETIEVVAKTYIKRNEEINIRYTTNYLAPLNERQKIIRDTWNFECVCQLCRDPSENGSYLSAIVCQKCKTGSMLPVRGCAADQTSLEWRCSKCGNSMAESKVESIVTKVSTAIEKLSNGDLKKLKSFLVVCKSILHPNHFLALQVRRLVLNSAMEGVESSTSKHEDIKEILEMTAEFIKTVECVDPGFTKWKSKLLYQTVKIELIHLLQGLKERHAGQPLLSTLESCIYKLEMALAGMTGEAACLGGLEGQRTLTQRMEALILNPNLGQGYTMLLNILNKLLSATNK